MSLILTRRPGETVLLGKGLDDMDIEVKLVSVQGNQVKLGFSAPEDVVILREEVYEREINGE